MINSENKPEGVGSNRREGEANGIVESEAERFVHVFTTLAAVEQILLDVVTDSEQCAASGVGSSIHPIRAGNAPCDGG